MSRLINWDKTFTFDVNPDPTAVQPIALPTYGNYGGLGYSGGVFGPAPSGPPLSDKKLKDNVDALDYLFYKHDIAVGIDQDAADLALLQGIVNLSDKQLAKPEAELYAGLATLAISARLVLERPDLALMVLPFLQDAVDNIVSGLGDLNKKQQAAALDWLTDTVDDLQSVDFPGTLIDQTIDAADMYLDFLTPSGLQVAEAKGWLL